MALDTYAALQTSVANWLQRTDLVPAIPDFITLAEAQMNRRLLKDGPVRQMLTRLAVSITDEFLSVPADFMGAKAFSLTDSIGTVSFDFAEPDQIENLKAQYNGQYPTTLVSPSVFTVTGGQFQFWPWSSANAAPYSAELSYWQRIPALTDVATSNWVLANHPDAYLYGALLQSAPYLKEDERISVWANSFATILSDIVEADKIQRHAPNLAIPTVPSGTP